MNEYFLLHDGYSVELTLYNGILKRVEGAIPKMKPGRKYELRRLCGYNFWDPLGPGKQRIAGRSLSHMVVMELLPLTVAKANYEYPKQYKLK
jgi:hypothetical protein